MAASDCTTIPRDSLVERYNQVHRDTVADLENVIQENEAALRNATGPSGETHAWLLQTIRASIPLLKQKLGDYQQMYREIMRDTRSQRNRELMQRAIDNAPKTPPAQ